jgi:hypothetical protein
MSSADRHVFAQDDALRNVESLLMLALEYPRPVRLDVVQVLVCS